MKNHSFIMALALLTSCNSLGKNDQLDNSHVTTPDTCEIDSMTEELFIKAAKNTESFIETLKLNPSFVYILDKPLLEYLPTHRRDTFKRELMDFAHDTTACASIYNCLQFNQISSSTVGLEVGKILNE